MGYRLKYLCCSSHLFQTTFPCYLAAVSGIWKLTVGQLSYQTAGCHRARTAEAASFWKGLSGEARVWNKNAFSCPSPMPLLRASLALGALDGLHPDVCMSPRLSLAFWVVMQMTICATILNARYSGLLCTLASTATYPSLHRRHSIEQAFAI